jgi:hypothetical protein
MIQQTHWRKGAFKYYFKFIANFTNHTLGILKPKYCSRAGHYWPWISVYFEGIAANKQGIDGQWPLLNSRPGGDGGGGDDGDDNIVIILVMIVEVMVNGDSWWCSVVTLFWEYNFLHLY